MKKICTVSAGLCLLLASFSSSAMCVYNETPSKVNITFICGPFCKSNWVISPGAHKCRLNKSGNVLVDKKCNAYVGRHGKVSIKEGADGLFCATES